MRSIALAAVLAGALAASAVAQPSINANGIVNAASYAIPGLPNSSIAQGSIFLIFGANMGPSTLKQAGSFPIPTNLGGTTSTNGTSVTISAGGQSFEAPILYTTASQVAAILPSTATAGSASATVSYNGGTSGSQSFTVVPSSFGTFAVNQQGNGAGVITDAKYHVFLPTAAAMPGDVVIIWGTGLGPVSYPDGNTPNPTNLTSIAAQVWVGNTSVTPSYRGRSGCCAGLDQIVFKVPSGITGCSVPVTVTIGDVVGQTTTMPITTDTNRICSDPNGFTSTILETLQTKGSLNVGIIDLSRSTSTSPLPPALGGGTSTSDSGSASFSKFTPTTLAGATGVFQQAAIGSCIVYYFSGSGSTPTITLPAGLDAGAAININGPNGKKQLLPDSSGDKGEYSATLSSGTAPNITLYLDAGSYTADNGTGGADVQAFNATFSVAQPLTWTNQTSIAASPIIRSKGVTTTWTGGAPGTFATISGSSILSGNPTDANPTAIIAIFVCLAPVEAGTFTVGPNVLGQLPASTTISEGGVTISLSSLSVGNASNPVSFTAPGLDVGYIFSGASSSANVVYQ